MSSLTSSIDPEQMGEMSLRILLASRSAAASFCFFSSQALTSSLIKAAAVKLRPSLFLSTTCRQPQAV
jgi:hypothetical protein